MPKAMPRIDELFWEAAQLADGEERNSYLARTCGDDRALRQRLDRLLKALPKVEDFLEQPFIAPRQISLGDEPRTERPGMELSPYMLLKQIGEGGLLRAPGKTQSDASGVVETTSDFLSPALKPGASFGRFLVIRELGRGSYGVVFLAFDPSLDRAVALKVPHPEVLISPGLRARFRQEARAAAGLDHPNLVPVYEVGEEGPVCYIASGYCPGITLAAWLKKRTESVPYRQAALLLATLADAVAHAHERGVVHRDLKPGNILLQKDGEASAEDDPDEVPTVELHSSSGLTGSAPSLGFQPKITDFGLAKLVEGNGSGEVGQTQTGAILGTPSYMAPEQAVAKKAIGPAADIYALGAILYELLAGRPPFVADSTLEVLLLVRDQEPLAPSGLRPKLPRDLETICLKCLHKEPSRRYASARELVGDLRRYLAGEPIQARPVGTVERLMKWTWRRPAVAALVAGLALAVGTALVGAVVALVFITEAWDKEATARHIADNERALAGKQKEEARYKEYVAEMNLAQREYEASNLGTVRELLAAQVPRQADATDWRNFEWHYWQRMAHREVLVLEGHSDWVYRVDTSPDGRRLASASRDQTIRIWDAATGQHLLALTGHTGPVLRVRFSPDGRSLASASEDGTVHLWDSSTGQTLRILKGHTKAVRGVSFSPDGRRLASASSDETVRLWDPATGEYLLTLKGNAGDCFDVAFSPDGRRLATANRELAVKVWDAVSGRELLNIIDHKREVVSVSFSPDGRRLISASRDPAVKIWDADNGKEQFALSGHTGVVWAAAFSPDGRRLASAGEDHTVRLWDAASGQELLILKGHTSAVFGVSFSPDGRRLTSASQDHTVRLWDAVTGQELLILNGHTSPVVMDVSFSPDGRRLASASHDIVRVWDASNGLQLLTLKGHKDAAWSLSFSPDGRRLASASRDQTVRLWDASTGQELLTLKGHTGKVYSVVFSPDSQRLASASGDHTVRVWDAATGKEQFILNGHTSQVYGVSFSPDGRRLASASADQTVRLWDTSTGQDLLSLRGHTGSVFSVSFCPDCQRLASASEDQTVRVWDTATGKEQLILRGHTNKVLGVSFSPDGSRLASSSEDHTVRLWDTSAGKEVLTLKGHTADVGRVSFSPDGSRLASAAFDRTVRVWETRPVSAVVWRQRALLRHVTALFDELLLREKVLTALRQDPTLDEDELNLTVGAAESHDEEPPGEWNVRAWSLVRERNRGKQSYARALYYAECASLRQPRDGLILNTVGVSQYRLGRYADALATLTKSDKLNTTEKGSHPDDLAFLAMAQHLLGNKKEAKALLGRLRQVIKLPRWSQYPEAASFLHEAEELIEGNPGKKVSEKICKKREELSS